VRLHTPPHATVWTGGDRFARGGGRAANALRFELFERDTGPGNGRIELRSIDGSGLLGLHNVGDSMDIPVPEAFMAQVSGTLGRLDGLPGSTAVIWLLYGFTSACNRAMAACRVRWTDRIEASSL
jgi:hypothetical protein